MPGEHLSISMSDTPEEPIVEGTTAVHPSDLKIRPEVLSQANQVMNPDGSGLTAGEINKVFHSTPTTPNPFVESIKRGIASLLPRKKSTV